MPREPVSTVRDVSADVLSALDLPPLNSLTVDQRRGAICAWGTSVLTVQNAYDLGERQDEDGRLFLRGCAACTEAAARRAYRAHARSCPTCISGKDLCSVRTGLRRLALDARRLDLEVHP